MIRPSERDRLRRLAAALAVPIAALAVLASAAPAWAGGQVHVPGEPVVVAAVVDIAAKVDAGSPADARLELRGPGFAKARQVAHAESGFRDRTLVFRLDLSACNVPNEPTCAGGDAPNGTWTAQLFTATRSEPIAAARFEVRVPARQPTGVTATVDGRAVVVSWDRGTDRDLSEWRVVEHSGESGRTQIVAAADCPSDAARCTTAFSYADSDTGSRDFTVQAVRTCADQDCGSLASEPSAPATATLPEPSPATPSPAGDGATPGPPGAPGAPGGGGAPGSPAVPGASGAGGPGADPAAAAAAAKSFAQSFNSFAPKLGLPKLPPLPTTATQPVPAPQLPDGGFEQTLGYEDRVVEEQVESSGRGPVSVLTSVGDGVLASEEVARGVAGALVLVLSAAHLRRWLATASRDAGSA